MSVAEKSGVDIARERIAEAKQSGDTHIDLQGLGLRTIPEELREVHHLRRLHLTQNPIEELPSWIGEFSELSALHLGFHRLRRLPLELRDLTKLEVLGLTATGLEELPAWMSELRQLRSLFIGGNALTSLPEVIGELPELRGLFIHDNQLATLPDWLRSQNQLTTLTLDGNPLEEVPTWLGELSGLVSLGLSGLALHSLPTWLATLTELGYLDVSDTGISVLPDFVCELGKLETLIATTNRLRELPERIGSLSNLTTLILPGNEITSLPASMRRLSRLTDLNLQANHLTSLPDWLLDLPQLSNLVLYGNPLLSPPPEIAMSGQASVLEFLRARRDGSTTRQWTSKMLVVGEGGVGKTSTIKALLGEEFDKSEETTHGLKIYPCTVDHPDFPDKAMLLRMWDFGGQQIYHATHQFFLSDRSLFLLLWNSRLGWEQGRLRYWLDIISARAPESPILLVATNTPDEGRPADLPLDDLCGEYPQIHGSISIDNETRDGLEKLRQRIAQEASGLPLMGAEWPIAWIGAMRSVHKQTERHITPTRLWQIMDEATLHNEEHKRYVADAMHHLGEILFYKDVPSLADTVILRPEWVNEYISKVLDSAEVEQAHGLLSRAHVNELWSDLDRGMRDHFLDMMDRYDLSYRLDGTNGDYVSLVVERLPWTAPHYEEQWNAADLDGTEHEIRVLYQLNTTPPGIPTWFIARTHRFTTGTHWRTGALLAHPDGQHRALVKSNPHRHQVELAVRGPSPAAFFSVLDDGLTLTLDRYPGLSVKRLVPCPCQNPQGQACEELFDYDDLVRRLNRTPPRHQIECRKSGQDVSVSLMLLGLAPSRDDALRESIDRLERGMTEQYQALADRLTEVGADMQRAFLKVQHQVQLGLETRCPSVFTVVPLKLATVKGSLHELRLYCEEPGAWHPLPEGEGCYQIKESPEWLHRYGPYLHRLITVLKHVAPLVNPVLGMAVGTISSRTKSDVDTMKALVDQLPSSAFDDRRITSDDPDPAAHASSEGDFRALEAMLTDLDPTRRWGGLSRIDTPEGLALYLCPDHAEPYRRVAPAPVALG